MLTDDWIPEELLNELRQTLKYRWIAVGFVLTLQASTIWSSIIQLQAHHMANAIFMQIISVILLIFSARLVWRTLVFKYEMKVLIESQENELHNETLRMLAQIEVQLEEGNENGN